MPQSVQAVVEDHGPVISWTTNELSDLRERFTQQTSYEVWLHDVETCIAWDNALLWSGGISESDSCGCQHQTVLQGALKACFINMAPGRTYRALVARSEEDSFFTLPSDPVDVLETQAGLSLLITESEARQSTDEREDQNMVRGSSVQRAEQDEETYDTPPSTMVPDANPDLMITDSDDEINAPYHDLRRGATQALPARSAAISIEPDLNANARNMRRDRAAVENATNGAAQPEVQAETYACYRRIDLRDVTRPRSVMDFSGVFTVRDPYVAFENDAVGQLSLVVRASRSEPQDNSRRKRRRGE
jgi:hypothetical protein